jgi:hypothetical protein
MFFRGQDLSDLNSFLSTLNEITYCLIVEYISKSFATQSDAPQRDTWKVLKKLREGKYFEMCLEG